MASGKRMGRSGQYSRPSARRNNTRVTVAIQHLKPLPPPAHAAIDRIVDQIAHHGARPLGHGWSPDAPIGQRLSWALHDLETDLILRTGVGQTAAWCRGRTEVPEIFAEAISEHWDLERRRGRPRNPKFAVDFLCRLALLAHEAGIKRSAWARALATILRARGIEHRALGALKEGIDRHLRRLGAASVVLQRGLAAEVEAQQDIDSLRAWPRRDTRVTTYSSLRSTAAVRGTQDLDTIVSEHSRLLWPLAQLPRK